MSVSTNIKKALILKIQSCASVQEVYGYEETDVKGWPAVMIVSSDMAGEFSSTSENRRSYAFDVLILFPMGENFKPTDSTTPRLQYAEEVVATVIDEIINAVDTDFELTDSDSTVLFVNAANCQWGTFRYEGGIAKAATITLVVVTDISVQ